MSGARNEANMKDTNEGHRHTYFYSFWKRKAEAFMIGLTIELYQCLFGIEYLDCAKRLIIHCGVFALWIDFPFSEND